MDIIDIVGTLGALASVTSFAPQAWKTIRARSTEGLSKRMYMLTVFGFTMWTTYGVLKQDWALILPNSLCLALSAFILMMILLPDHKTAEVAAALDPTGD